VAVPEKVVIPPVWKFERFAGKVTTDVGLVKSIVKLTGAAGAPALKLGDAVVFVAISIVRTYSR